MSEDKGRGPLLPISGLAIFLAALGLSVFNPTPFKGLRPSVNELREPNDRGTRHREPLRPHHAIVLRLDDLGFAVDHQAKSPTHGDHGQRLE